MVEARSPGLPRYRTFRPPPGPARPLEEHAELSALGKTLESARRLPEEVANFLVTPLPGEALAFFVALVFPLLLPPVWLFSSFCAPFLSCAISLISVWAWACGAALISVRRWPRASRAASDLALAPLPRWILL